MRRRRGANPCSMGDRRDLGLGRNHRPVSENCSEALTGSSWPSALIRAPCGVRVISDAVTHRTAAACEPVANAGQLGQHLNAPAGAGRLGCRWQALARVGAGDGNRTHLASLADQLVRSSPKAKCDARASFRGTWGSVRQRRTTKILCFQATAFDPRSGRMALPRAAIGDRVS